MTNDVIYSGNMLGQLIRWQLFFFDSQLFTKTFIFLYYGFVYAMYFEICDIFALFVNINLLTSTYSSRQSTPPLSSYRLFKF